MNIVDILLIAILAFGLLAGMYKGFLTSLLSTLGFIGSWFVAKLVYAPIANLALSNTTLMAVLSQYLEPESFFASQTQAALTVSEVVSGGEAAIQEAVATVSSKLSIIANAFENNIRNQAFANLNITTLADYLDQTIWQAVFGVLAFLVAFIVIYLVVMLLVNLLDHVIRFPVLRMFDWLLGGLLGLVRAVVFAVLIITIVPAVISLISPELTQNLISQSTLYSYIAQLDFLHVKEFLLQLIG